MKKYVTRILAVIAIIFFIITFSLYYMIKHNFYHDKLSETSAIYFAQLQEIMGNNETHNDLVIRQFEEQTILKAQQVAYVLSQYDVCTLDQTIYQQITDAFDIDELHIFNKAGNIVAGNNEIYIGVSMNDGDQIGFFKPMLKDPYLELVQDIMPNTSTGKNMQYAAIWNQDHTYIVQIGQDPAQVLESTQGRDISHVFDTFTLLDDGNMSLVDHSGTIVASTDPQLSGKSSNYFSLDLSEVINSNKINHIKIDNKLYCVYALAYQDYVLVRLYPSAETIVSIFSDIGIYFTFLISFTIILVLSMNRYLDTQLIKGVNKINLNLSAIEKGNDYQVDETIAVPELHELSLHINQILNLMKDNYEKITSALQMSQIRMGIVESNGSNQGFMTNKMNELLHLPQGNITNQEVVALIESIISQQPNTQEHIYNYTVDLTNYYLRIEKFDHEDSTLYVLIDVSADILKQKNIERERDTDALTSLYNRRGFYDKLSQLFTDIDKLHYGTMLLLDMDNLKEINDNYGHPIGDIYIEALAHLVAQLPYEKCIPCRLGGDEFAVFIYGYQTMNELMRAIDLMKEQSNLASYTLPAGPLRFSFGFSTVPDDSMDYRELMRLADERMYLNKQIKKHTYE